MKLAYLQSTKTLEQRVFFKYPAPELNLKPNEYLELLRQLYGLSDAGDFWNQSLHRHLVKELKFNPNTTELSLRFSFHNESLVEIFGSCIDELLQAGTEQGGFGQIQCRRNPLIWKRNKSAEVRLFYLSVCRKKL